ncbi:hypothetical protein J2X70_000231 [Stenotrophomonas sp. 1337]|nr:hypothetical protein [Stenotrophomonas sp. 1337]
MPGGCGMAANIGRAARSRGMAPRYRAPSALGLPACQPRLAATRARPRQNLFPAFTALYSLQLDIKHRGWKRDKASH